MLTPERLWIKSVAAHRIATKIPACLLVWIRIELLVILVGLGGLYLDRAPFLDALNDFLFVQSLAGVVQFVVSAGILLRLVWLDLVECAARGF